MGYPIICIWEHCIKNLMKASLHQISNKLPNFFYLCKVSAYPLIKSWSFIAFYCIWDCTMPECNPAWLKGSERWSSSWGQSDCDFSMNLTQRQCNETKHRNLENVVGLCLSLETVLDPTGNRYCRSPQWFLRRVDFLKKNYKVPKYALLLEFWGFNSSWNRFQGAGPWLAK